MKSLSMHIPPVQQQTDSTAPRVHCAQQASQYTLSIVKETRQSNELNTLQIKCILSHLIIILFIYFEYKPKDSVLFLKVNNLLCLPQKKFNMLFTKYIFK